MGSTDEMSGSVWVRPRVSAVKNIDLKRYVLFAPVVNALAPELQVTRTYLKKRILVQNQGGREVQPGGILAYFEDLNRAPNAEFGPKGFFEMVLITNKR